MDKKYYYFFKYFFKVNRLALFQAILFIIIIVGLILFKNWLGIKSFLLGASAWFIPNIYFLLRMQKLKFTFDSGKMLKLFLMSEMIKLALSFGIIILILIIFDVDKLIFLGGYALMVLSMFLKGVKNG